MTAASSSSIVSCLVLDEGTFLPITLPVASEGALRNGLGEGSYFSICEEREGGSLEELA